MENEEEVSRDSSCAYMYVFPLLISLSIMLPLTFEDERLGLRIAPENVRLQPQPQDGYPGPSWSQKLLYWNQASAVAHWDCTNRSAASLVIHLRLFHHRSLENRNRVAWHWTMWVLTEKLIRRFYRLINNGRQGNDSMSSCISFTAKIRMLETANEERQVHLNRTSAQLHESLCDGKPFALRLATFARKWKPLCWRMLLYRMR